MISHPTSFDIRLDNLGARRGHTWLFDGVSLRVAPGGLLWIQGRNGSGKTTLLKFISGLSTPSTGQVQWHKDGVICRPEDLIVFQGHKDALKPSLTVNEELNFWADIYDSTLSISETIHTLGLSDKMAVATQSLSAGQARRLVFARLILSGRPVGIMDEPTAAIDTEGRQLIQDLITQHISAGGSAIIASHQAPIRIGKQAAKLLLEPA